MGEGNPGSYVCVPTRVFPLVDQLFGALLQFGNWSLAGIDVPLAYGYEGYL